MKTLKGARALALVRSCPSRIAVRSFTRCVSPVPEIRTYTHRDAPEMWRVANPCARLVRSRGPRFHPQLPWGRGRDAAAGKKTPLCSQCTCSVTRADPRKSSHLERAAHARFSIATRPCALAAPPWRPPKSTPTRGGGRAAVRDSRFSSGGRTRSLKARAWRRPKGNPLRAHERGPLAEPLGFPRPSPASPRHRGRGESCRLGGPSLPTRPSRRARLPRGRQGRVMFLPASPRGRPEEARAGVGFLTDLFSARAAHAPRKRPSDGRYLFCKQKRGAVRRPELRVVRT